MRVPIIKGIDQVVMKDYSADVFEIPDYSPEEYESFARGLVTHNRAVGWD